VPQLPHEAEEALRSLRQADGPAVEPLPLLCDASGRDARGGRRTGGAGVECCSITTRRCAITHRDWMIKFLTYTTYGPQGVIEEYSYQATEG